eukprot:COSAG05_NODE_24_length_31553_cov_12.138647_4_plen_95_part_00
MSAIVTHCLNQASGGWLRFACPWLLLLLLLLLLLHILLGSGGGKGGELPTHHGYTRQDDGTVAVDDPAALDHLLLQRVIAKRTRDFALVSYPHR